MHAGGMQPIGGVTPVAGWGKGGATVGKLTRGFEILDSCSSVIQRYMWKGENLEAVELGDLPFFNICQRALRVPESVRSLNIQPTSAPPPSWRPDVQWRAGFGGNDELHV